MGFLIFYAARRGYFVEQYGQFLIRQVEWPSGTFIAVADQCLVFAVGYERGYLSRRIGIFEKLICCEPFRTMPAEVEPDGVFTGGLTQVLTKAADDIVVGGLAVF